MSLHVLANHMASKGRGEDSMLVHMTPAEVASLQALAMKNGGSLTLNPDTGLPEAGFLKKLLPAIAGAALNFFAPGVGTAIGGALGLSGAAGAGIAVGGLTTLATGSLSKGLAAGFGAYGGAGLANAFTGAGAGSLASGSLGAEALTNAGYTPELAAGTPLSEASSLAQGAASQAPLSSQLSAGFNAVKEAPGAFLKDNWKYGLAAAAPIIADAMVPTTVKAPDAKSMGYIRPYQFDENTRTVKAMDPVLASEWGNRQFPDYIRANQNQAQSQGLLQPQIPGRMARGGIVALAEGGDATALGASIPVDPYAQYNKLSGQSKAAYDYLMGNATSSGTGPVAVKPVVPAPTPSTTPSTTPAAPIRTALPETDAYTPPLTLPETTTDTDTYDQDNQDAIDKIEEEVANEQYDQDNQDAIDRVEDAVYDDANQDAINRLEEYLRDESLAESARASDIDDATISIDPVYVADDGTTDSIEDTIRQITPVPETPDYVLNQDEFGDLQGAIERNMDPVQDDGTTEVIQREALAQENPYGNLDAAIAANNLDNSARASDIDNATIAVDNYDTYSRFKPEPANLNIPVEDRVPSYVRNDGGYCPAPWINILLADGSTVKAGDIKPGMEVYTRHETTNEWGVYPVSDVEMSEGNRWEVLLEDGRSFVGTFNHRVHTGDGWTKIRFLKAGDKLVQPEGFGVVKSSAELDYGPVVRITVEDAHTYVSEGFLSHNVKNLRSNPNDFDYSDYDAYDWEGWANGGMVPGYAIGGLGSLGGYSDGGRLLKGPGDGVSDSIPATIGKKQAPARLADGEFVIPARIVSELGNGSTEAGARKLYAMMDRVQKARGKTVGKGKVAANPRSDKHLPA